MAIMEKQHVKILFSEDFIRKFGTDAAKEFELYFANKGFSDKEKIEILELMQAAYEAGRESL